MKILPDSFNILWMESGEDKEIVLLWLQEQTLIKWWTWELPINHKGTDIIEEDINVEEGVLYCDMEDGDKVKFNNYHWKDLPWIEVYLPQEEEPMCWCGCGMTQKAALKEIKAMRAPCTATEAINNWTRVWGTSVNDLLQEAQEKQTEETNFKINNKKENMYTTAQAGGTGKTRLEQARIDKFLGNDKNIDAIIGETDDAGNIVKRLASISSAVANMAGAVNMSAAMLENAVERGDVTSINKYKAELKAMNKQFTGKGKAVSVFDLEKMFKLNEAAKTTTEEDVIKTLGL